MGGGGGNGGSRKWTGPKGVTFLLPPFLYIFFVFNNTDGKGDIRGERRDWQTTGD